MKIEKGKLYYNTQEGVVEMPMSDMEVDGGVLTNKIAVHCPTKKDWDYVNDILCHMNNSYDFNYNYKVLTDEGLSYNEFFIIRNGYHIITIEQFKEFYPENIMKTKKVYTEATPLLIELWKDYKGKKTGNSINATHFDNCDIKDYTGDFHAQSSYYDYEQNDYTHLNEQEFIEFMDLQTPKQGYKESTDKLNYELDFNFITQMAERMASNKGKYEPFNWQKPMDVDKLKQSLMRHVIEVMKGKYSDDGRELGHIEAIAANAMMINYQIKNNG